MLSRLLFAAAALALSAACGNSNEPRCQSSARETQYMGGCANGGGPADYCACTWDYLAERHECEDFVNVTFQEAMDACRTCGGAC
jgi:hypothetical protein